MRKGQLKAVRAAAEQYRALTEFTTLPPGHMTFRIEEDGCEPHLKEGEYAVIDMTDRSVQNGELFLIQYQSGNRARRIVQVKSAMSQITPFPSPKQVVWWLLQSARFPAPSHPSCRLRRHSRICRPLMAPIWPSVWSQSCWACRRLFHTVAQQGSLPSCGL